MEPELADAPVMDGWSFVQDPAAVRLAGWISMHPTVLGPTGVSSRIYGLDPELQWARTYSRLWRLGPRGRV